MGQLQLTITLGDLVTIGTIISATVAVYIRLNDRLTSIEIKLAPLWKWWNDER